MSAEHVTIRAWQDGDAERVADLLDPTLDPLWVAQAQQLHGPELEPPRMRITRLAVVDGDVVGVGSIGSNPIHPGRYPAAIEVLAAHRRQGIGSRLLATLMELRPKPLPLSTKIRRSDAPAMAFAHFRGGSSYQECDGTVIDPTLDSILQWTRERLQHPIGTAKSGAVIENHRDICDAFVDQYHWVHQDWSPVGDLDVLREESRKAVADLDNELSVLVCQGDQTAAAVFVFRALGSVDIVAETTKRDSPEGKELLEHGIAVALRECNKAGVRRVEFDGHVTDPHLQPIVTSLPDRRTDPLCLMEFQG